MGIILKRSSVRSEDVDSNYTAQDIYHGQAFKLHKRIKVSTRFSKTALFRGVSCCKYLGKKHFYFSEIFLQILHVKKFKRKL